MSNFSLNVYGVVLIIISTVILFSGEIIEMNRYTRLYAATGLLFGLMIVVMPLFNKKGIKGEINEIKIFYLDEKNNRISKGTPLTNEDMSLVMPIFRRKSKIMSLVCSDFEYNHVAFGVQYNKKEEFIYMSSNRKDIVMTEPTIGYGKDINQVEYNMLLNIVKKYK